MENNNQFSQSFSPLTNPKGSRFTSAAFSLGILSITCGLFLFWTPLVFIAFAGGGLAILFAILSKGNYKNMDKRAKTGFIFGIIGPIFASLALIFTIVSSFYLLRNDDVLRKSTRETLPMYEETIIKYYGEDFLKDYESSYGKKFDLETTFDQLFGK